MIAKDQRNEMLLKMGFKEVRSKTVKGANNGKYLISLVDCLFGR